MMSDMIETESKRSIFINEAIKSLRSNEYDGLDLDFECKKTAWVVSRLG